MLLTIIWDTSARLDNRIAFSFFFQRILDLALRLL